MSDAGNRLFDWWRGFSSKDVISALQKTESTLGTVWLSREELNAWLAFTGGEGRDAHPDRRSPGRRQT